MAGSDRRPTRRLLLLGASNLSRGLPTLLATARRAWPDPLDVVAVPGRGRSYGLTTRILGRELSSIVSSGAWQAWRDAPALPTSALLTDIGNDIMYGVTVEQILAWVEEALRRLREGGATTVVTSLPTGALGRMGPRRYKAIRTLLFPRNRDDFDRAMERVAAVDEGVRRLARTYGAALIEPSAAWYGLDPIHIRFTELSRAWSSIVGAWQPPQSPPQVGVGAWDWIGWQLRRPAERRLFGIRQLRIQPCATFIDGTRVSMY